MTKHRKTMSSVDDICTPASITEVKVPWNYQTAKFFLEKLGVPFDKLPDEAKQALERHAATNPSQTTS